MAIVDPSFELPVVTGFSLKSPQGWTGAGGSVWVVRSGSNNLGGIVASDGKQLTGLQANGASIQQAVRFSAGSTYALTFYAASRYDGLAALTVTVGVSSLTVAQPLQTKSMMAIYTMRFVADVTANSITFSNTCGSYCYNMVLLDSVTLQLGKLDKLTNISYSSLFLHVYLHFRCVCEVSTNASGNC